MENLQGIVALLLLSEPCGVPGEKVQVEKRLVIDIAECAHIGNTIVSKLVCISRLGTLQSPSE